MTLSKRHETSGSTVCASGASRILRSLPLAAIVLGSAGCFTAARPPKQAPPVHFRPPADASRITVRLLKEDGRTKLYQGFDLDASNYEEIVGYFTPADPCSDGAAKRMAMPALSCIQIVIYYKDGDSDNVTVYFSGKNPMIYSISDNIYMRRPKSGQSRYFGCLEIESRLKAMFTDRNSSGKK